MSYSQVPRNYFAMEYPLPHEFFYKFFLAAEDETRNSTIATILRASSNLSAAADSVEVNPEHASFVEETGPTCQMGSIIPRMSIDIDAYMPVASYTGALAGSGIDDINQVRFNWMPIYTGFIEPLESLNTEDDATIESVLELAHNIAFKTTEPLFSDVNLLTGAGFGAALHPIGTVNDAEGFADFGLDGDAIMESVAFDSDQFFDTLKYGSNKNMLKSIIGQWHSVTLTAGRHYHFNSNNFTFPKVKRMNPFTYCGILFHVPQASSSRQLFDAGDTTATIPQVGINLNISFPEWNSQFDQTAA